MASSAHVGDVIDRLLPAFDLLSVFLFALGEKFMPLMPSYVLFPAIGMSASGAGDLLLRCLVATVGSVGGAAAWYSIGALIGPWRARQLVARHGRWLQLKPPLYELMTSTYGEHPFCLTVVGQMIPIVRIVQALPAGVLRLPMLPFLAATAIGAQCWIVPLALAGHLFRRQGWSAADVGGQLLAALLAVEALAILVVIRRPREDEPFPEVSPAERPGTKSGTGQEK